MPPPPATLTAVRASEALFLGLAAHGVHKRFWVRPAKGQPEPVTDSSASLLTLAFVLLLGFLFSTGKKTALFAPFIYKMHYFTKTGSGQT